MERGIPEIRGNVLFRYLGGSFKTNRGVRSRVFWYGRGAGRGGGRGKTEGKRRGKGKIGGGKGLLWGRKARTDKKKGAELLSSADREKRKRTS